MGAVQLKTQNQKLKTNKVARHPTALAGRRYRCYLPVLAEFTRLSMHGTWPTAQSGPAGGECNPYFPFALQSSWIAA
jgi:hypothetical protein